MNHELGERDQRPDFVVVEPSQRSGRGRTLGMPAASTEAIAAESALAGAIGADYEIKYGFHVAEDYFFKSGRGLSHELVDAISSHKDEPDWMRRFRHRSLDYFYARPVPQWGGNLNEKIGRASCRERV